MKSTKIICTIGPACTSEEILIDMVKSGMDVARLNFSHGSYDEHRERIELVKKVRKKLNTPIAIMLDTKGPEYRIKTFKDDRAELVQGEVFTLTSKDIIGDNTIVSVSYENTIKELKVGDRVLINNGLVVLDVESITDTDAVCRVVMGGILTNRKSMSFPNKVLKQEYLSEVDKADILFGIEIDVDFIACSFVSCKDDILAVREFLNQNGGENIDLIAKIENRSGVDNIKEILEYSDGIMVARGDLGVEIPYEELPAIQKYLITTCRLLGKRVITATEMLESMITSPRPTRAEISDVANAVYDGTSAIMLSGETAVGKYPVEAVAVMSKLAKQTESDINYHKRFRDSEFEIKNSSDAISHATCALSMDIDAKLIVVCTMSGTTARMVSRFRSPKPIVAMTTNEKVWNKLSLSWGVIPIVCEEFQSVDVLLYCVSDKVKQCGLVESGDNIVITAGMISGRTGSTNLIKLKTID
ncbi:MAG: pyruvate kinase [Clostridia bacterium]|nr:pyruvate kinase [Clostridia bacterium]